MRRLLATSALLLLSATAFGQGGGAVRFVEFAWPEVEDAAGYELEFATDAGTPLQKQVKKNAWKGELPVGKYKLRVRSQDRRGVPGKWGKPIPLALTFPAVEHVAPAPAARIAGATKAQDVSFSWKAFDAAARYRLEVKDEDGKNVGIKETDTATATLSLPTARKYVWAVTALLPDGTPGEEPKDERDFTVLGPQLPKPKVSATLKGAKQAVKWTGATGATAYRIKVDVETVKDKGKSKSKKLKAWRPVLPEQETDERSLPLDEDWPNGRYRVRLVAMAPLRAESEPVELVFKREAATAAAGGKATPRHRFVGRYLWQPHTRDVVLSGARAQLSVPSGVMNAHAVGIGWRLRPAASGLLANADFDATIVRSFLFGEDQVEEGSEQSEVRADAINPRLMTGVGYRVWHVGVMLHGGYERRQLVTLFPEGRASIDSAPVAATDPIFGGSLAALFSRERELTATFLLSSGDRGELTNYSRAIASLTFTHRILRDNMAMTYGAVADESQFDFVSPEGDQFRLGWSETRFNLGVGFLF